MNPSAIYSKSGKGVQEASGKTSLLKRGDRAVLSAIDGRATLGEVAQKVGKSFDPEFEKLIHQLDKDGFVREVSGGPGASGSRPAAAPAKPAPAAAKAPPPKSPVESSGGSDLDFTTIMPALKPGARPAPPAPKPAAAAPPADSTAQQRAKAQESALYKAREEAEAKGQAERDRVRQEVEAKARTEAEAKIRAETEKRLREEADAKVKAEAEAKAKAKADAEAHTRVEAERKAREEVERKAKEEADKARREAEELRQRLEEERKAREAEERRRRDDEDRRRKDEEERRAREEAERKAREDAERQRREEEEDRRMREEIEAKARAAAEAARREEEERHVREKEDQARRAEAEGQLRRAREEQEARAKAREEEEERARKALDETRARLPTLDVPPPPPPKREPEPAKASGGSLDALMADLDSFSQREEQERESREAAERKARDDKKRRSQEDGERKAREAAERKQREHEERRQHEEEERRAQEEAERRVREAEEQRRLIEEERKRKTREAAAAAAAKQAEASAPKASEAAAAPPPNLGDIGVTDDDLDMDDVKRDEAAVARDSRKAQREREREARQREKEARERAQAAERQADIKYPKLRRKVKWGKPVAITLFVLLIVGVGVLHVMPLPMEEYQQAASAALGRPVKIGSGRLSLYSGVRLNLENVTVGNATIAAVHAYPEIGSLFDEKKAFKRIELNGVTIPQQAIGETLLTKTKGENFTINRIFVKGLRLEGPVPLPVLDAEAVVGPDGALRSVFLSGPEQLSARLTPAGSDIEFDVTAASIALPIAPEVTLNSFAMKGVANRQGMNIVGWGGSVLDGALSGTANVRWASTWTVDGVLTVRGINAAVFAPALLSEGKAEGTGRFQMSGVDPARLGGGARLDGSFTVIKGVLGSFDLSRAISTGGRQFAGRTPFTEMIGQGQYDRGAVTLRNVNITAGALNAAASADIAPGGAISGRIVADIRTNIQPLRATLIVGGTVRDPQVRN